MPLALTVNIQSTFIERDEKGNDGSEQRIMSGHVCVCVCVCVCVFVNTAAI